jgi:hypothetical protein
MCYDYTIAIAGAPADMGALFALPGIGEGEEFRVGRLLEFLGVGHQFVDAQFFGKVGSRGPAGLVARATTSRYRLDGMLTVLSRRLPELAVGWAMQGEGGYLTSEHVILRGGLTVGEGIVQWAEAGDGGVALANPEDPDCAVLGVWGELEQAARINDADGFAAKYPHGIGGLAPVQEFATA